MSAVLRIAVYTLDTIEHLFTHQVFSFFTCLLSVNAQSEHNANVFVYHSCPIELVHQYGQHLAGGHGSSDIACYDHNLFVGLYYLLQGFSTNRIIY